MKKYLATFQYMDTTKRGLNFKPAKKTVRARSEEEAADRIKAGYGTVVALQIVEA